ncbi:MAG: hypothetical protein DGJ47_000999 [Rickettsiaceae bacterium]
MIISVVNQKGGVGKTTTAVNLATVLAVMEKKVLLIDIDSQGNSSSGLGFKLDQRKVTSYQIFTGNATIQDATLATEVPGLSIITANTNLSAIEVELMSLEEHELILKNQLDKVKDQYDYIIIDCPPSLNLLTLNALVASREVLIPMLCDFYSLEGLSHLLKTIEIIEKKLNPDIKIGGILFTMYDKRNKLTELVEQDVRSCLGDLVFKTVIPRNIKLSEAPSHGKSAIIYDHKCTGSKAYIELAKELIAKR